MFILKDPYLANRQQQQAKSGIISQTNNNNISNVKKQEEKSEKSENSEVNLIKNLFLTDISNRGEQSNNGYNENHSMQPDMPGGVKGLLEIFETVLPVINQNFSNMAPPFSNMENHNLGFSLTMNGKFEMCFIDERKLAFKKREFISVSLVLFRIDYLY